MDARAKASAAPALPVVAVRGKESPPKGPVVMSDDDHALVAALKRGDSWASTVLVRKYQARVERVVAGALGIDSELSDVIQDVFISVLRNVHQVKDPTALPAWISSLAVFTARALIRKRRRWRWIRFLDPNDVPEAPAAGHDHEGAATMRAVYVAIDKLPADERLAFTLRFVSELELTEVAAACQVSLATIKRRLSRAEARFAAAAATSPLLRQRLEKPGRFGHIDGKQVP